jgi:hypothetical protein
VVAKKANPTITQRHCEAGDDAGITGEVVWTAFKILAAFCWLRSRLSSHLKPRPQG